MLSPFMILSFLLLALITELAIGAAMTDIDLAPAPAADQDLAASSFIVSLTAADYFPHAKDGLSPFDINTYFTNYNADTRSWLSALDPHTESASDVPRALPYLISPVISEQSGTWNAAKLGIVWG